MRGTQLRPRVTGHPTLKTLSPRRCARAGMQGQESHPALNDGASATFWKLVSSLASEVHISTALTAGSIRCVSCSCERSPAESAKFVDILNKTSRSNLHGRRLRPTHGARRGGGLGRRPTDGPRRFDRTFVRLIRLVLDGGEHQLQVQQIRR